MAATTSPYERHHHAKFFYMSGANAVEDENAHM